MKVKIASARTLGATITGESSFLLFFFSRVLFHFLFLFVFLSVFLFFSLFFVLFLCSLGFFFLVLKPLCVCAYMAGALLLLLLAI